ncbi:MAG TPA: right-handed parallel beta-helix repeat-containing protein [Rhodothermales bacterium]|nr:right-handed parallel beta-helix repeat-containing protein [Rhodothermales bacterium]
MYTRFFLLLMAVLVLCVAPVQAQQTVYVAPDGSPIGSGSLTSPVGSIATALTRVAPGDTIYVRGGTYASPDLIRIDDSGEEGNRLHIWAYPGETPVFDFTGAPRGFDIRGDYLHLKGFVAENANDNGVYVKQASYNIIEQVVARYNGDSGVQVEDESAHNLLLNVDSYGNYDAGNHGENADGFAIKFGVGPGNVLRGCRAWGNSDDGYDFWSRDDPGQQGITVENSWAFNNGINVWSDTDFQGDSNGFKLGHGPGAHVLTRNLAWGHLANGFDVNGNLSGVTLYNNTAYLNGNTNFYFDDDQNVEQGTSVLRNNLSFGDYRIDQSIADDAFNTWNSGMPNARSSDFLSTDDTGADGPRQPDGSLPDIDFLHLAPGSDLIDAGTDVGLPYAGGAPDLGAFEVGLDMGTAVAEQGEVPSTIQLFPNYPNPFNPSTQLTFEVREMEHLRLSIYNALGQHVATLIDEVRPAGRHTIAWNTANSDLPNGVYIARLEAARSSVTQSMILLK